MERRPRTQVITTCRADEGLLNPVIAEMLRRDVKASVGMKNNPDLCVLLGDRYETLEWARTAVHDNIPIAHIHGGDVSGCEHMDDKFRDAITMLSDLHFAATERSCQRLRAMGTSPNRTWSVGSPALDDIIGRQHAGDHDYVVVLQHPVSGQSDRAVEQLKATLSAVSAAKRSSILIYPNDDPGGAEMVKYIEAHPNWNPGQRTRVYWNLPRDQFIDQLCHCRCLVGNSSAAYVECSYLGVPCVDVWDRQNGRENAGNVVRSTCSQVAINASIWMAEALGRQLKPSNLYGDGHASERIVEHILEWWDDKIGGQPGRHHA